MHDEIEEKIQNIGVVVDELKVQPHTYKTILQDRFDHNCTLLTILRRKLNRLQQTGVIGKSVVPQTRNGMMIWYAMPKEYHIIVESDRMCNNIYYFSEYENMDKMNIRMEKCWKLSKDCWKRIHGKVIYRGKVLKWI